MANKFNPGENELKETLVCLNRVSKTVKGGRVARFAALKNMITVSLKGTTIPHEVVGIYGAGKVMLKPAALGTGIIAGGKVRAVLECAGISNIRAKCLRSDNPTNVVKAVMAGLQELRSIEEVARIRDIPVDQVKA